MLHLVKQPVLSLLRRRFSMATSATATPPGLVESSIREKLTMLLQPTWMVISNESSQHRHHVAMREQGGNGETHFSVAVISDVFTGKNTMQRHRMVYSALSDEFSQGLHSLSLNTKTSEEAERAGQACSC